jgi:hypothetical protein
VIRAQRPDTWTIAPKVDLAIPMTVPLRLTALGGLAGDASATVITALPRGRIEGMIVGVVFALIISGPVPLMAWFAREIGGPPRWPIFLAIVGLWLGCWGALIAGAMVYGEMHHAADIIMARD